MQENRALINIGGIANITYLSKKNNDVIGFDCGPKWREARQLVKDFHHRLCTVRVLDPACGSGNFLYVTLEHLKRFEGEVLNQLVDLGES